MKIRTDFVTNSSSSSFSIIVAIETKDGRRYSFEEDPYEYSEYGGNVDFCSDLKKLLYRKKPKYSNVKEIAKFLMDSIVDDYEEFDDEFDDDECEEFDNDEWGEFDYYANNSDFAEKIQEEKESFIQQVSENISSVNDISKIIVSHEYCASGEFADLIADNDKTLCTLAKKVNTTVGDEQKEALEEMCTYIHTSNGKERQGENFGIGYDDIRYVWDDDEEKLLALAKRLCSSYGPGMSEGREIQELDFKDGSIKKYAEFDLC